MASGQTTKKTSNGGNAANRTASSGGGRGSGAGNGSRSSKASSSSKSSSGSSSSRTSGNSRGSNGGRGGSSNRTRSGAYNKEEIIRRSGMYDEVKMLISLAVSVILLISVLNFGGRIGGYISRFLFGVFGWLAYVVPFIIFFGTAFLVSNKNNRVIWKKAGAFICFFVFLLALLQMIVSPFDATTKITDYYINCSVYKNGGGIIGGAVCYFLTPLFGKIGCYVIIFIGILVGIVLIAERAVFTAIFSHIRSWFSEMRETNREKRRIRAEIQEEALADAQAERAERKAGHGHADKYEEVQAVQSAKHQGMQPDDQIKTPDFDIEHFKLEDVFIEEPKAETQTKDEEAHATVTVTRMVPVQSAAEDITYGPVTVPSGIGEKTMPLPDSDQINAAIAAMEANAGRQVAAFAEDASSACVPVTGEGASDGAVTGAETADGAGYDAGSTDGAVVGVESADWAGSGAGAADGAAIDAGLTDGAVTGAETAEIARTYVSGTESQATGVPMADTGMSAGGAAAPAGAAAQGSAQARPQKLTARDTEAVTADEIREPVREYVFPPVTLLEKGKGVQSTVSDQDLMETAMKLQKTLESFGVGVQVTNVSCGPTVTRYELTPDQGVKVSRIVALANDIKLNLAAAEIRIEAPIPGKSAVGIEVPNSENTIVYFRDLVESAEFRRSKSNVTFAVGRDIGGQVVVADIAKMPHLLIAGATGSGKSVCINTLIMSIIYKSKPEDVRLIMIDPKVVELSVYNGIPHLLIPVVTDPKKAAGALNWAVMEMTDRYSKFAELGVREIHGYNEKIAASEYESETYKKLPQIVIIVDELADLMMVASSEVEDAICRLAQLARAAGIHLVIATQRPSVNVITGVIKANVPSRIAFAVSSGVDSRTIIDMVGAEKLLGKGDMLFYPSGMQKPQRVQGAFVSDREVNDVVEFLREQNQTAEYSDEVAGKITSAKSMDALSHSDALDVYFADAGRFIIEKDKASIGMLQRVYKIGFNRAARIMDQLCEAGVVGPEEGTKPRKVLMSPEQFETYVEEHV